MQLTKNVKDSFYQSPRFLLYEIARILYYGNGFRRMSARRRGVPAILLNALPRSGSVFVWTELSKMLRIPTCRISTLQFPYNVAIPEWVARFSPGGAIAAHAHLSARKQNILYLINYGLNKMIVHVRDPRQALLSWTHHLTNLLKKDDRLTMNMEYKPELNYLSLPLEEQLDYWIDTWYPLAVNWLDEWVQASEFPGNGMRVLFTRHEDLVKDPDALFERILDFYNIDKAKCYKQLRVKVVKGNRNFRKGETSEWRRVFTEKQIEKTSGMIPVSLLSRFEWER